MGIILDYVLRACCVALFAVSAASAQYEVPRKASEYPANATWPQFEVGAEYLIHSVPAETGAIYARDYLVIEVAVYPLKGPVAVLSAHFALHVNDRKTALYPESAGFVGASEKYPNWSQDREVVGTAQVGDGTVTIGPRRRAVFRAIRRQAVRQSARRRGPRQIRMPSCVHRSMSKS